jgi:hypothetical protein
VSNFFAKFGLELAIFVHVIAATAKLNLFGLLYLIAATSFLFTSPSFVNKILGGYLAFCNLLMIFQYFSSIGYPPFLQIDLPWYNLPRHILRALGLPVSAGDLYITPDFTVFYFACLLFTAFTKNQIYVRLPVIWSEYDDLTNKEFTAKPR